MKPYVPAPGVLEYQIVKEDGEIIKGYLWKSFIPSLKNITSKEFKDFPIIDHKKWGETKLSRLKKVKIEYLNGST